MLELQSVGIPGSTRRLVSVFLKRNRPVGYLGATQSMPGQADRIEALITHSLSSDRVYERQRPKHAWRYTIPVEHTCSRNLSILGCKIVFKRLWHRYYIGLKNTRPYKSTRVFLGF